MNLEPFKYVDGYRSSSKYFSNGNVNIILSAPHGGSLMPDNIPDRTESLQTYLANTTNRLHGEKNLELSVIKDTRTDEFVENVANELKEIWNLRPFILIAKWNRLKVDFNRDIFEGTLNHPETVSAYENYHTNLNDAVNQINHLFGKGLLFDIHGHSQGDYTMIGYMLSRDQLNQNDLSDPSLKTSIDSLCRSNRNECIRGQTSIGSILERHGLGIVYPSSDNPKPGSRPFFSGGYIIRNNSPKINSIQIELPYDIRAGIDKQIHAKNLARAIVEYMKIHNLLMSI